MTMGMPEWALEIPSAPVHPSGGGLDLTRPFTIGQLLDIGREFLEQFIKRVVLAVAGFFIPGMPSFDQLVAWSDDIRQKLADVFIIGDLVELITGIEDGDPNDLGSFFLGIRNAIFGLDLSNPGAIIGKILELIGAKINEFFSAIFGGLDLTSLPSPEEVWATVTGALIKPLNIFSIPTDVQASIGVAINHTKAALEGTYSGADPIFLAVKNAAAQWLTGSSPLNAGKLTGTVADGLTPGLGAVRDAIYQALNGGSTTGVTAAQVKSALTTTQTTVTNAATNVQGVIDAGVNAFRNTPLGSGHAFDEFGDALADQITAMFNKFGGNNAARASLSDAIDAMQTVQGTLTDHTTAINVLQNLLKGSGGYSHSTSFRQPETTSYITDGTFTWTPPSWFVLGTDIVDVVMLPGGGGAQGGNFGVPGALGADGGDSTVVVNGITKTAVGGQGNNGLTKRGDGPGPITYLDILYPGGGHQNTDGASGKEPGGGGCAVLTPVGVARGGMPGLWNTSSTVLTASTVPGVVGDGGNGGGGTHPGGSGRDGVVHLRARAALPSTFTSMGTLILPTFKLNAGVAQTDAMTAAAVWSRVPPNGASGGYILIIRADSGFNNYVYLRVWYVAGVTYWALGKVSAGVAATPWKSGTIAAAIPFNAFSLTSDSAWTFTIAVNGSGFDSFTDSSHTSSMGASYRGGGFATSDSDTPGSITQFAFLDTGTPSRITSAEVATAQTTTGTAYQDLATSGPSVTLNVPASGEALIHMSCAVTTTGSNTSAFMGFVMSGSNTAVASDARAANLVGNPTGGAQGVMARTLHLTGLTPGTTTFKAQFKAAAATATLSNRILTVEPKP